jgi:hypothetical protein
MLKEELLPGFPSKEMLSVSDSGLLFQLKIPLHWHCVSYDTCSARVAIVCQHGNWLKKCLELTTYNNQTGN